MKILQVSTTDLIGSRFNGFDLNRYFRNKGHDVSQCVWVKKGVDKDVWILGNFLLINGRYILRSIFNFFISVLEKILSIQSIIYPWGFQLLFDKRFRRADVVHYHLLHSGFFSLLTLISLTRSKPSVWTVHDPWAMTGHCVHPQGCMRWLNGCGSCPDVKRFIPMWFDNSRAMFKIKMKIYKKLDMDLVVSSNYMLEMVKASPVFNGMRVHLIPFGIDTNIFKPGDKKKIRGLMGIPEENFVISFRATKNEFKGLAYIKSALSKISARLCVKRITILTVNERGLLRDIDSSYQIVELGTIADEFEMADFYNASDLFLMPSTGEAFGMMAIESMACGTPVVVFEGTALPDVVFAPQGGVSVPRCDADALCAAIIRLLEHPEELRALGTAAFNLAREHYVFAGHAEKIMALYEAAIERKSAAA